MINQRQWRGAAILPTNIYVCPPCLDAPQEQLRSIALAPDPVPVYWPLTEPFTDDEDGNSPVYGVPVGLDANAVMPFNVATQTAYGVLIDVLSVFSDGAGTITVTCAAAHGLATNGQIAVEGLSNGLACGFFSVTVTTATAFTYALGQTISYGPLLTSTTRIITALVGLPYGVTQIPQVFVDANYQPQTVLTTETGAVFVTQTGEVLIV